ncbi:MAG: hypothetical protein ABWX65_13010 [Mycetocola sp.]
MLYLKPPFHIIEGTAVFPDHANETQFYFLPAMPHLTTLRDPVTGLDIPQLQLIKFRGEAGTGGFLTFEVNLGLEQERIDAIAAELKTIHRLRDNPVLAPAILEGGTVRLIILGRASDDNGQPILDDEQQPRFVVRQAHASAPALYGDNQAVFSVELDQDGVQLIESSIVNSELMPVGVIYSLDFFGLRPAFSVRITADWNRVQTHLEENFKAELLFASVEIDKVVDKLVEDQVVQIEVDSFLPEGEDGGSWIGRRDQAIDQFKDMVLENFFQPSIEPMKEEKDGWDRFADTAERLALIGATGGWGGVGKFSYVKKDLTRIDEKRANLQMNERVTVRRSIYPQATLKGLGRFLRDAQGQIDVARFIQSVNLNDPWFERRVVTAHSLVDFDHDKVDSVNVTLTYDGQPRTVRLTKATPSGTTSWNSRVSNGVMERGVDFQYRVTFRDVDTTERPGVITTTPERTIGDEFEVSPRAAGRYYVDDIQIGAGSLPWARYPQVAVEVRYADLANGVRLAETFLLTESRAEATWTRFRLDPVLSEYDVRITFLAVDHNDVLVDWTRTDQERLIIRDPHPLRRTVQIAPAVDWNLVAMVFVELRYVDEANDVDEQQTLAFFNTPADKVPKSFTINLVDATQRLVSYGATIVLADNRTLVVPPSMTAGSTVVLRTDMAGHRIVTLVPPDVDFASRGLTRIEAHLTYQDSDAGLSFEDDFTFSDRADRALFEFDYAAVERAGYRARVTLILENGLVLERDLGRLTVDRLMLPSA